MFQIMESKRQRLLLSELLLLFLAVQSLASVLPSGVQGCPDLTDDEICCNHLARKRDPDFKCCKFRDKEIYLNRVHCDENEYVKPDKEFGMCGNAKIPLQYEDCCDNGDTAKPFILGEKKCCIGRYGSKVIPYDQQCCNGLPVNPGEMCCEAAPVLHKPVPLNDTLHTNCCVNQETEEVKTYDPKIQKCIGGELHEKSGKSLPPFSKRLGGPPPQKPRRPGWHNTNTLGALPPTKNPKDGNLKYCGYGDSQPYSPSEQICCISVLHNYSTNAAECCGDKAFLKNDTENPCMAYCGKKPFNRKTDLCCDGNVFKQVGPENDCCSRALIDRRTQECCGKQHVLEKKKRHKCCKGHQPYHEKTMQCDDKDGTVKIKSRRMRFKSSDVCKQRLVHWRKGWPLPPISNGAFQIRGHIERCGVQVTSTSITIPLSLVQAISGGEVSYCLSQNSLEVIMEKQRERCFNETRAQRYLRGKTLHLYLNNLKKLDCTGKVAKLRIADGDKVFIITSNEFDTIFKES